MPVKVNFFWARELYSGFVEVWGHLCMLCLLIVTLLLLLIIVYSQTSLSGYPLKWISSVWSRLDTHTRLMALCLGLPGLASTRKVTPIWILLNLLNSPSRRLDLTLAMPLPIQHMVHLRIYYYDRLVFSLLFLLALRFQNQRMDSSSPCFGGKWGNWQKNLMMSSFSELS